MEREIPKFKIKTFQRKKSKYCLIIPVLNEGKRLDSLLKNINSRKYFNLIDIVIVDGGSDNINFDFFKSMSIMTCISHLNKKGLSCQLRAAYSYAMDLKYEGVITIDGNNKDDPNSLLNFIDFLNKGFDLVQGSRFIKNGKSINLPLIRYIAIRFIHSPLLSLASGFYWTDTTQGFRAYSRNLLLSSEIRVFRDVFMHYELLPYMNYIAPRLNFKCIEIPTTRIYPKGKIPTKIKSFNTHFKLLLVLIKTCLGYYSNK